VTTSSSLPQTTSDTTSLRHTNIKRSETLPFHYLNYLEHLIGGDEEVRTHHTLPVAIGDSVIVYLDVKIEHLREYNMNKEQVCI
jgi:hypothetical protein